MTVFSIIIIIVVTVSIINMFISSIVKSPEFAPPLANACAGPAWMPRDSQTRLPPFPLSCSLSTAPRWRAGRPHVLTCTGSLSRGWGSTSE